MLNIQSVFKTKSLANIIEELNLKATYNLNDDRVILNYTIDSPKFHPITEECRGLVLNKNTGELIARAFNRFYNIFETDKNFEHFNWNNFICQEKHDGSLIILYYWNNNWHINTRSSFGDGNINDLQKTWHDLFYSVIPIKDLDHFDKKYTYIFELVGPYNKIVRLYQKTDLILLSVFNKEFELPYYDYLYLANTFDLKIPTCYPFHSLQEIEQYIKELEDINPTHEGVVIRDTCDNRWKIKNKRWFDLSKIRGDGGNLFNPKYLLPFILKNEHDELLTYFPEVEEQYDKYYNQIWTIYKELNILMNQTANLKSQKEFALAIKHHPLCAILFNTRKNNIALFEEFTKSTPILLKYLKEK